MGKVQVSTIPKGMWVFQNWWLHEEDIYIWGNDTFCLHFIAVCDRKYVVDKIPESNCLRGLYNTFPHILDIDFVKL